MSKALRLPAYRLRKATGQGVVSIDGRDLDLGEYISQRSLQRDHEMMANRLAGVVEGPTVTGILLRYRDHAAEYYRKDGKPTSEVWLINRATTQKLYPGSLLDELRSLPGLRRGRCRAPERPAVEPVGDDVVAAEGASVQLLWSGSQWIISKSPPDDPLPDKPPNRGYPLPDRGTDTPVGNVVAFQIRPAVPFTGASGLPFAAPADIPPA